MTTPDLSTIAVHAVAAAKRVSRDIYVHNYAGEAKTIAVRQPNAHTIYLTRLYSWNYAKQAGCSVAVARSHLRRLVAAKCLIERKSHGGASRFSLMPGDAEIIGREIIAELQAEGLPFDDDWRAARKETA